MKIGVTLLRALIKICAKTVGFLLKIVSVVSIATSLLQIVSVYIAMNVKTLIAKDVKINMSTAMCKCNKTATIGFCGGKFCEDCWKEFKESASDKLVEATT